MKKTFITALSILMLTALISCGKSSDSNTAAQASGSEDTLTSQYGFQWTDPNAPILNEKGAQEISSKI